VKIRGFRIELGEIESMLQECDEVREAVVLAQAQEGMEEKRLVAYLTRTEGEGEGEGEALDVKELRRYLKGLLPEYMVPGAFVELEAMPLTPNGKLDQGALPTPDGASLLTRDYEAPAGDIEEMLSGIWQEILHVDRIGRHDNFFELGGHSLMAMQVVTRIRQKLGSEIALEDLFKYASLNELALRVQQATTRELPQIERADRRKPLP
jgi:acyl carrier protein